MDANIVTIKMPLFDRCLATLSKKEDERKSDPSHCLEQGFLRGRGWMAHLQQGPRCCCHHYLSLPPLSSWQDAWKKSAVKASPLINRFKTSSRCSPDWEVYP
ncbi:hypothetical protein VULLAG_LOCUS4423 [Vulpes lagopus]